MTKCDKCPQRAIIHQRYSGMHLCRGHFEVDVHRKIREVLRRTGLFGRGARIAVGLDGGRKSATLAFVLKNLFISRSDMDIFAVIIDEGEKGRHTSAQAIRVAEEMEMAYIVKGLPRQDSPGGIHSVRREELLICSAKENGAGILATGEDLDDEALKIFISYLRGNADAVMPGIAPAGENGEEHIISWIKPLRRIPGKEVRLYAIGHGLGYADAGVYTGADALKWVAKRQLFGFDCRHPGTNYSLLRGLEKGEGQESLAHKGKAFK